MIFVREGAHEARHKRFHSALNYQANAQVAGALNTMAVETCKKSGIPYFIVDQSRQSGSTFGSRLTDAFRQVFDEGFEQVIAIGNDCPGLSSADLIRSRTLLEEGKPVLGPAKDGGVYLIGLHRALFETGLLDQVTWNTSLVYQQLISQMGASTQSLPVKIDIDQAVTKRTLKLLRKSSRALLIIITGLIRSYLPILRMDLIHRHSPLNISLRAPPAV